MQNSRRKRAVRDRAPLTFHFSWSKIIRPSLSPFVLTLAPSSFGYERLCAFCPIISCAAGLAADRDRSLSSKRNGHRNWSSTNDLANGIIDLWRYSEPRCFRAAAERSLATFRLNGKPWTLPDHRFITSFSRLHVTLADFPTLCAWNVKWALLPPHCLSRPPKGKGGSSGRDFDRGCTFTNFYFYDISTNEIWNQQFLDNSYSSFIDDTPLYVLDGNGKFTCRKFCIVQSF